MTDTTTDVAETRSVAASPTWAVVAWRELCDLWLSGRALALMLAQTALLSITTYLVAINQELNFIEQREAVSLTLRVAVAVGGLLVMLSAADAISGERERGTLESLLLTPAPRRDLLIGKGLAALSLWVGAYALALPYLWWLGRDVDTFGAAATGGLVVGTLLALFLVGVGLLISAYSDSNALSLALSFFVVLALFAPTQMPTDSLRGWAGELLTRIDPFTGALTYLDRLIVQSHSATQDADLLVSAVVAAVVFPALAWILGGRLSLLRRRS